MIGAGVLAGSDWKSWASEANEEWIIPPSLKRGDTIGITCPAGYISYNDILPAIRILESWGFRVKPGKTVGKRDHSFGGSDEERAADMQAMLDDEGVGAILSARGGYGSVRMIDRINLSRFRNNPKWIIGFSDLTVFHSHIGRHYKVATMHAKMCNSFPDNLTTADPVVKDTLLAFRDVLMGEKTKITGPSVEYNRYGSVEGRLTGGNLSILQNLAGTASEINTNGMILFVEEVGEYLYNIDRMFWNLERSGKLKLLKGLIVGGFNRIKPDDPGEEFGRDVYRIVMEKAEKYNYPVCFDFPVGHQRPNYPLVCGGQYRFTVGADGSLLERI